MMLRENPISRARISAVDHARRAGLAIIPSGRTPRAGRACPILGASRSPRSLSGRSKSSRLGSLQLDLACRTTKSVFNALDVQR